MLLVGGASGVGKTTLARQLADEFGVDVLHVDDLQAALEASTTPQQQPGLHFWRTNWDEFSAFSDEQLVRHFVEVATGLFEPVLVAVVAQHLDEGWPVIIEGDFVTPHLVTLQAYGEEENAGRVQALFLHEDEAQISHNYGDREGDGQGFRAHASGLNGQWLGRECQRLGVPTIAARPWDTTRDRAIAAMTRSGADPTGT